MGGEHGGDEGEADQRHYDDDEELGNFHGSLMAMKITAKPTIVATRCTIEISDKGPRPRAGSRQMGLDFGEAFEKFGHCAVRGSRSGGLAADRASCVRSCCIVGAPGG